MPSLPLVVVVVVLPLLHCQYQVVREDPLALLTSSLVVVRREGREGEEVTLSCEGGDTLGILTVHYTTPSCSSSPRTTVRSRCHGRTSCTLTVSPASLLPSTNSPLPPPSTTEPCTPTTSRSLLVTHHCRPPSFRWVVERA